MPKKKKHQQNPYVQMAQKRVRRKKSFYKHLKSYLIVNTMMSLFLFWDSGSLSEWVPVWIFWGIGLAFHYFKTFGFFGIGRLDEEWERREIEKELRRRGIDPAKTFEQEDELDLEELKRRRKKEAKYEEETPQRKYREEDLL